MAVKEYRLFGGGVTRSLPVQMLMEEADIPYRLVPVGPAEG